MTAMLICDNCGETKEMQYSISNFMKDQWGWKPGNNEWTYTPRAGSNYTFSFCSEKCSTAWEKKK